jgi:predicted DNA binding CopG/RHH family protein
MNNQLIQTRVSSDTVKFIKNRARAEHISVAAWLRRLVEKEHKEYVKDVFDVSIEKFES